MSKCEWKDVDYMIGGGSYKEFSPCDDFNGKVKSHMPENSDYYEFRCCSCGADIRKPEPEQPIIKKSGETWVYKADGIDYFVDKPEEAKSEHCLRTIINNCGAENVPCAKPISEIDITDEIAKLRPMVVSGYTTPMLVHVGDRLAICRDVCVIYSTSKYRLATVSDLESK